MKEEVYERLLWWLWIAMTTLAASQVFLYSTALCWIPTDESSHAKSPEVSTVLELPVFSTSTAFLQGQLLSHCWKLHAEAVNRLNIDRWDWTLLLFDEKHVCKCSLFS